MKNEKDQLIQLTPQQQNPGSAKPTDFVIEDRDGGQCGDTKAERARLLKEAMNVAGKSKLGLPIPDRNDVNEAGEPHGHGIGAKQ